MDYSVAKLKTAADCDQSVALATDRKNDLIFDQTVLNKELGSQQKSTTLTEANLISVKAEITGTEAAIEAVPDGDAKTALQSKLRRLNDRKENLEERLSKAGTAALLDSELDGGLIEQQLTEIDAFIAAVNTRKEALA